MSAFGGKADMARMRRSGRADASEGSVGDRVCWRAVRATIRSRWLLKNGSELIISALDEWLMSVELRDASIFRVS